MQNSWGAIKRINRVLMLAPIVGALSFGTTTAQSAYPDRTINMLVGFSAGDPTDPAARVLGEFLSQELGQPIVITNKPGVGGLVAARDLMNNQPDGYTIYLALNGIMTVAAARYEKLDYDPPQDMAAV